MKTYDLIVIGAGSGLNLIPPGWKAAVIEKGPMGGTCLNRGCIPSKIVIHAADVAETIQKSKDFGMTTKISKVNFAKITKRASNIVDGDAKNILSGLKSAKNIDVYQGTGKFVGNKTLRVGNKTIKGKKIVIAVGARPNIPPVEGLKDIKFWTSTEALRATKQPKTLTVIGGGYIGCELAHFYGALGTKINIIQRNELLMPNEDSEIAKKFTKIWKKKYNVLTGYTTISAHKKGKTFIVHAKPKKGGKVITIKSDALLVATGIKSNADTLDLAKTGVKANKYNYVNTNDYLETNVKGIYALGDCAGKYFFKHSANEDAGAIHYSLQGHRTKPNYKAMPHAVFSSPQIAGVGYTEDQLKEKNIKYVVGKKMYTATGMGTALQDNDGFAKVLVDPKTRKILGCHIMGADASTMIHEIIVAMRNNLTADHVRDTIHIHPALSEVVHRAFNNI